MASISDEELAGFGWPALLVTRRACVYTGQSRHAIGRAVRAGELCPAGKRGRSWVFRRADLDQWLCGRSCGRSASDDDRADGDRAVAPIVSIVAVRRRAPVTDSLVRIRRAGGRGDGPGDGQ